MLSKKKTAVICAGLILAFSLETGPASGARLSGDEAPASQAQSRPDQTQPQPRVQATQANDAASDEVKEAAKPAGQPARKVVKKVRNSTGVNGTKQTAKAEGKFVNIDFDNVDIAVFIKSMGEVLGKNFIIDNQVKGNVTVYSPKKISFDEAYKVFESVLEVHGYTTIASGDMIKVIPSRDAKEKSIETRLKSTGAVPEDKVITQIVSLTHASPDEMKKILDPLISRSSIILSYPPTGMLVITDVYSNIKRLTRIIGTLDVPGSGEQITVIPLKNAASAEVAKALASVFQVDQGQKRSGSQAIRVLPDERTNTVIVMATEFYTTRVKQLIALLDREVPKGDAMMHAYRLQNANAEDLAKVLMSLPQREAAKGGAAGPEKGKAPVVSKAVQVLADKSTNTLIITAARDDYKVLEEVIKSLDVPRAMVYLEALIMEVSVTKSFKLGVEWRFMNSVGSNGAIFGGSGGDSSGTVTGGAYSILPPPVPATGQVTADFPSGFSFGILKQGLTLGGITFPTIGAALQAIQQDTDIHILSTPQILTMDNEDAEIRVGQNVPYLTRQDTSASTPNVAYSNYEYRDVGVMLKVTPHINEDGFVRLKIGQEVTQIVSQDSGIRGVSAPTTLKRTANTVVTVKDNNTVVIGGIIGDSSNGADYQVPCLGNIPLVGNLFKSKATKREKTNLFVFLTPRIVRTQQDANGIYQEKRGNMRQIEEGTIKMHEQNDRNRIFSVPKDYR